MRKPFHRCVSPNCEKIAQYRGCGMCDNHYRKARYTPAPPMLCKHSGCGERARPNRNRFCAAHFVSNRKPCQVEGCGKRRHGRGYCFSHYMMLVKYGDPLKRMVSPKGFSQGKTCCMVGCVTPTKKLIFVELKFYCKAHYTRLRKYGDPHFIMKPRRVPKEEKKQRRADACRRYNKTPHGRMRLQFNKAKVRAAKYGCDSVTGIPQEVFIALHSRTHCAICGQFMPENDRTLDHIVALSEGGANSPNNLQTVHLVCNCRKGGARGRRAKQYVPPPAKKVTHSSVAASPGT